MKTVNLTLKIGSQLFLHDIPAVDDAPPHQVWLQKLSGSKDSQNTRTNGHCDSSTPPSNKARQKIIGFTSAQHTHISNLTFQTMYRNCQNSAIACCLFLYRVQYWFFAQLWLNANPATFWSVSSSTRPLLYFTSPFRPSWRQNGKYITYVYVCSLYTTKRAGVIENSNRKEKSNGTILPIHGWQMFSCSATVSAGWVCALPPLTSISNTLFYKDCSFDPVKNLSNN